MRRFTPRSVAHARRIIQCGSDHRNGSNHANRNTGNTRNRDTGFIPHNCAEIDSASATGNTRDYTSSTPSTPGAGVGYSFTQECRENKAEAAALVSTCRALLAEAQAIYADEPSAEHAAFVMRCRATLADAQHTYRDAQRIYSDALIQLGAIVALQGGHSHPLTLPQPRKHSIQRRTARAVQHQERQHQWGRAVRYTCLDCGHQWTEPLDGDEGEGEGTGTW